MVPNSLSIGTNLPFTLFVKFQQHLSNFVTFKTKEERKKIFTVPRYVA
jgi:hypothetical protein